jgi:hypothetical protein
MADLFACSRGNLTVMEGCEGVPGKILLKGFSPQAAIIVSPAISQRTNVQFQTSLRESVYVYVFGDQMGTVTVTGVAFATRCDADDSGLEEIFEYYQNYRASQRQQPIEVTFGKESISGFLTASDISSRDPSFLTLDFKFTINTLPKKAS